MFSFLKKSPPVTDPLLGQLTTSRSYWRGFVDVNGQRVPLVLAGSGSEPEAEAIVIARDLSTTLQAGREALQQALFDHYTPYGESEATEPGSEAAPAISSASEVWRHIRLESVSVTRWSSGYGGACVTEVAISAAWDEEHTLGARFVNGKLVELNGSILPIG